MTPRSNSFVNADGGNDLKEAPTSTCTTPSSKDGSTPRSLQPKEEKDKAVAAGLQAAGLQELDKVILQLDPDDASYYQRAARECPEVIQTESNPELFWMVCKYNVWDASRRLVEYWKLRHEVFQDGAYQPIEKALSPKAQKIVGTGVDYLLPPDVDQKQGRTVLLFEPARFTRIMQTKMAPTMNDKLQASFLYLQWVSSQSPNAQRNGFIILHLIREKQPKFSPVLSSFFSRACQTAFPVKLAGVHVVQVPPDIKQRYLSKAYLTYLWECLKHPFAFTHRNTIHAPNSDPQTVRKILVDQVGLSDQLGSLPTLAGGDWTYKLFRKWYKTQQETRAARIITRRTASSNAATFLSEGAAVEAAATPPPRSSISSIPHNGKEASDRKRQQQQKQQHPAFDDSPLRLLAEAAARRPTAREEEVGRVGKRDKANSTTTTTTTTAPTTSSSSNATGFSKKRARRM